ncbi:hypothetical protein ACIA58_35980 [Kribbella sp. NPDC051586]|uniref:hypothetical protein n=1 Tax=Kribbella sp. NPDC051586 TaxID=3364118 RepID=UPI0037B19313
MALMALRAPHLHALLDTVARRFGREHDPRSRVFADPADGARSAVGGADGSLVMGEQTSNRLETLTDPFGVGPAGMSFEDLRAAQQDLGDATTQAVLTATDSGMGSEQSGDELDRQLAVGLAEGWTHAQGRDLADSIGVGQNLYRDGHSPYFGPSGAQPAADGLLLRVAALRGVDLGYDDSLHSTRDDLLAVPPGQRFDAVAKTVLETHGATHMPPEARATLVADLKAGFGKAVAATDTSVSEHLASGAVDRASIRARQFAQQTPVDPALQHVAHLAGAGVAGPGGGEPSSSRREEAPGTTPTATPVSRTSSATPAIGT